MEYIVLKIKFTLYIELIYIFQTVTVSYCEPDFFLFLRPGDGGIYYYTYGVGCSTVEIDCLTGEHKVNQTK